MALTTNVQTSVGLYAGKRYQGQLDTFQLNNVTDAILDTAVAGFGIPLARTATGVKPFTLVGDSFAGITVRKHTQANLYDASTPTSYAIGSSVPVANFGYIVVEAESNVTKGGTAYIRYASGAGGTALGAIRADADTSTAVAVTGLKFAETATAGQLVRVVMTQIFE